MASKAMAVDGMRLHAEMRMLATFTQCEQTGRDGETAVTRVVFSKDDMAARRWLKTLFAEAGTGGARGCGGQHLCALARYRTHAGCGGHGLAHGCDSACGHV